MSEISFTRFTESDDVENAILQTSAGPVCLDVLNTALPENSVLDSRHELHGIPRMATVAFSTLLNALVRNMPSQACYLNIGVWNGYSFLSGIIGNPTRTCIGVDNFSQFGGPRAQFLQRFEQYRSESSSFFDMDYRDYFERHEGEIGVYLFDGPHDYQHQYDALKLAHPFMAAGGIILVDDTNWHGPREATLDFLKEHSGSYELILDIRTKQNGHPTWWNGLLALERLHDDIPGA